MLTNQFVQGLDQLVTLSILIQIIQLKLRLSATEYQKGEVCNLLNTTFDRQ